MAELFGWLEMFHSLIPSNCPGVSIQSSTGNVLHERISRAFIAQMYLLVHSSRVEREGEALKLGEGYTQQRPGLLGASARAHQQVLLLLGL